MENPTPFAEDPVRAALAQMRKSEIESREADWPEIFDEQDSPPAVVLSPGRHAPDDAPPPGAAPELASVFRDTRQLREDGWTGPRRAEFLAALAETGVVVSACRKTGMSATSAYALRNRERRFADGWDAASLMARARLADDLADRAINGCVEQIYRDGCIVAERHRHDNRLSIAVLRRLDARCDARLPGPAQRLVESWDAYLTATEEGRDDDAAALAAAPPVPAPAENFGAVRGVGSMTTLQRQLVHLRSGYALDEDPDADPDGDATDGDEDGGDDPRVWAHDGTWRTNYPPPEGFSGDENGLYGNYDYEREVTPVEQALLDARFGAPVDEKLADAQADTAERDAFFAELARPAGEDDDEEGEGEEQASAEDETTPRPDSPQDTSHNPRKRRRHRHR